MLTFFLSAFVLSLPAVMTPGPMTTTALASGTRSRHAGGLIALGHAVVEMPLIILLAVGVGSFLTSTAVRIGLGLAGGTVLIFMGLQLLLALRRESAEKAVPTDQNPFVAGIFLTGANPYLVIWWATVGLALTTRAMQWGGWALLAFAAIHWLSDLVWLESLSLAVFKGAKTFGRRTQRTISVACAVVLLGFGLKFLYDAGIGVARLSP
jgi:threonine/homoserine/homoserine lactone efflux protein